MELNMFESHFVVTRLTVPQSPLCNLSSSKFINYDMNRKKSKNIAITRSALLTLQLHDITPRTAVHRRCFAVPWSKGRTKDLAPAERKRSSRAR